MYALKKYSDTLYTVGFNGEKIKNEKSLDLIWFFEYMHMHSIKFSDHPISNGLLNKMEYFFGAYKMVGLKK